MSMRGEIISKEYKKMRFVKDDQGREFACYVNDVQNLKDGQALTDEQRKRCLDTSQILGDTW